MFKFTFPYKQAIQDYNKDKKRFHYRYNTISTFEFEDDTTSILWIADTDIFQRRTMIDGILVSVCNYVS